MAKRPSKGSDQYHTIYTGIDPELLAIREVWVTQSGKMTMQGKFGVKIHHASLATAKGEVFTVFGLTDAFSQPVLLKDNQHPYLIELEGKLQQLISERKAQEEAAKVEPDQSPNSGESDCPDE